RAGPRAERPPRRGAAPLPGGDPAGSGVRQRPHQSGQPARRARRIGGGDRALPRGAASRTGEGPGPGQLGDRAREVGPLRGSDRRNGGRRPPRSGERGVAAPPGNDAGGAQINRAESISAPSPMSVIPTKALSPTPVIVSRPVALGPMPSEASRVSVASYQLNRVTS